MKYLNNTLMILFLVILNVGCDNKTKVQTEQDPTYPILLGLSIGENYSQTRNRLNSLEANGKIIKTSKNNFNFHLPLITDSISCRTGVDENDFYKSKFYQLHVYTDIKGSWQSVMNPYNELKELFNHKYTQITNDSSSTYTTWDGIREESRIFNKWENNDLKIYMEHYIVDITKVPENLDWNTASGYDRKNLSMSEISNKDSQSPGRYVIVLDFKYIMKSIYDAKYSEEYYKEDSLRNLEIQKRKLQKDSLVNNI